MASANQTKSERTGAEREYSTSCNTGSPEFIAFEEAIRKLRRKIQDL